MELLFENNRILIEEILNIISLYKVKYHFNNKLPDDTYKSLKAAIKLDKEIENTNKMFIDEIENENLINSSSKLLELFCGSLKNYDENPMKYYNIKYVQV